MTDAASLLRTWEAKYAEAETVHFQLIQLGGASYVWIGSAEGTLDTLSLGVPASNPKLPPSGTTLMGSGADGASRTMAQRLARKLSHPVFVSINIRDDAELRLFAERNVLAALKGAPPPPPQTPPAASAVEPAPAAPASVGSSFRPGLSVGTTAPDHGVGARTHETCATPEALGDAAVGLLLAAAAAAIERRGRFAVALSGGSIPKLVSSQLLAAGAAAQFEKWHVFLADERYVAEDDPDSSMGEWRRSLLAASGVPAAQIHALDFSLPLERAAAAYEAELTTVLGGARGPGADVVPPVLDAVVLGMGPDGHTASLFPGHDLLGEAGRWVAPIADSPKPPPCRISMTLPLLNAARLALFIVTGASKAEAVVRAFAPDAADAPAGLVFGTQRTHWLMDEAAAAGLKSDESRNAHLYG